MSAEVPVPSSTTVPSMSTMVPSASSSSQMRFVGHSGVSEVRA